MIRLVKAAITQEMMRNFVIERLLEQGIKTNQNGVSIYELDYETLKYELSLSAFREIDVMTEANRWF